MRELGASPLKTFSIGFKDQSYNELEHARRIARQFETEHEEFVLEPKALELTETLVRHLDEPFGDFSIFPTYLVSKMARAHVTVILSGDGGRRGLRRLRAPTRRRSSPGFPWPLRSEGRPERSSGSSGPRRKKKGAWNKLRRYVQGFDNPGLAAPPALDDVPAEKDKESCIPRARPTIWAGSPSLADVEPFASLFGRLEDFDRTNGELYLDLKTYLVDDILVKVDRMSMAPSLEARVPLIDHKLVEFAFTLPGKLKLHGLETKWIFKKTMERLLPRETIYRKKEGFSIPIKHWLRTDLKDMLLGYLEREADPRRRAFRAGAGPGHDQGPPRRPGELTATSSGPCWSSRSGKKISWSRSSPETVSLRISGFVTQARRSDLSPLQKGGRGIYRRPSQ